MSYVPINPDVVPLLNGLKPYLNQKGQVVTEGVLSIIQLLTSNPGQETVKTLSKVFRTAGQDDRVITVNTAAGPVAVSISIAFTLFLILILLILSGSILAFNPIFSSEQTEEHSDGDEAEQTASV